MVEHAPSCANRAQCVSCSKLAQLVKYHSKICTIPPTTSCPVIFCNKILRPTLGTTSKGVAAASSTPAGKDKGPTGGADAPKKPSEQSKVELYGEMLQLILHAQKCKVASCSVGQKCSQSKKLIMQMNEPDAPVSRSLSIWDGVRIEATSRAQSQTKLYLIIFLAVKRKIAELVKSARGGCSLLLPPVTSVRVPVWNHSPHRRRLRQQLKLKWPDLRNSLVSLRMLQAGICGKKAML